MAHSRPYVLSIAGSDPSGGAGVFADLKTLEAGKVYGLGVVSAITCQSDSEFFSVDWVQPQKILAQVAAVLTKFPVEVAKIGLIENLEVLKTVVLYLKQTRPGIKIIWDPILRASAGFVFHGEHNALVLKEILDMLYLITPNVPEALQLAPAPTAEDSALALSRHCHVLLKGGHQEARPGRDQLFLTSGRHFAFRPRTSQVWPKHGSGCVLAAALAANLAKDNTLPRAMLRAKRYVTRFLSSNRSLLGYHA